MDRQYAVISTLIIAVALASGCALDFSGGVSNGGYFYRLTEAEATGEHPWVVAVSSEGPSGHIVCTGAVIGPYTILTRQACVTGGPASTVILFGADARFAARIPVTAILVEPTRGELAVLIVSDPIESEVAPVAFDALEPAAEVRVVGYGLGESGASVLGVKHEADFRVERVGSSGAQIVSEDSSLCWGDFGAPAFDEHGRVVALVSAMADTCGPGTRSTLSDLVGMESFIERAVEMLPGCEDLACER